MAGSTSAKRSRGRAGGLKTEEAHQRKRVSQRRAPSRLDCARASYGAGEALGCTVTGAGGRWASRQILPGGLRSEGLEGGASGEIWSTAAEIREGHIQRHSGVPSV